MKTSLTNLVLALSLVGLLAGTAVAKDGGNKGSKNSSNSNSNSNHNSHNSNSTRSLSNLSSLSSNKFKLSDNKPSKQDNNNDKNDKKDKKDHNGLGIAIGVIGGLNGGYGDCHKNDNCHDYNNCRNDNYCRINTCNTYGDIRPLHDVVFVVPGDTLLSISVREYNNPSIVNKIAQFNQIPFGVQLIPGTQLRLPIIQSDGSMSTSNFANQGPYGNTNGGYGSTSPYGNYSTPNTNVTSQYNTVPASFQTPSFNTTPASEPLTSVAAGSTLSLDGQQFGEARGVVRLRIAGIALPVEVLEWTATSAKVQLPKIDLTQPTKADIEVLRADGSPASTTSVQLTPASTSLVLGN